MKKFVVYFSITLGFLASSLPLLSMDLPDDFHDTGKSGQSVASMMNFSDEEKFRQRVISILDNSDLTDQQKIYQTMELLDEKKSTQEGWSNEWYWTDEQKIKWLQKCDIIKALATDYDLLKNLVNFDNFYIIEKLSNPNVALRWFMDKDLSPRLAYLTEINLSNCDLYEKLRWDPQLRITQELCVLQDFLAPLAELHDLRNLDLSSNGIKKYDRWFVEAFVNSIRPLTNLTSLNLKENGIGEHVSFLRELPWLKSLNLESTGLEGDVSYLGSLTRLEELNQGKSMLGENMSFLLNLIRLKSLNLKWNWGISDLETLSCLTDLTNLNLEGNLIRNTNSLSPLTGLTSLNLAHSVIEGDANFVSLLSGLTSLNMEYTRIGGTGSLRKLPLLKKPNWGFIQMRTLQGLTRLENLYLGKNNIKKIGNLGHLTGIKNLNLEDNKVSHLEPLYKFTNLFSLNLKNNQISNIEDLRNFSNLRYLNLEGNPINTFKVLPHLAGLESLHVAKTGIEDVGPLSSLTRLKCLIVRENECGKHMNFLSSLTNLTKLDMENTGSTSLSFLNPLSSLTCLSFGDKGIGENEGSVFKSLTGLRFLNIGLNSFRIKDWDFIDVSSLKEIHVKDNDRIAIYLQELVGRRLKVENRTSSGVEKFQHLNLEYDWER